MKVNKESDMLEQVQSDTITLTPTAAQAVQDLLAERQLEGYALRVFVQSGGCCGFQYGMALENNTAPGDRAFESEGVRVLVDEVSIGYLQGASIDFVDGPQGKGFLVNNPNVASSCDCGSGESNAGCGGGSCGCH
jgi:iron-sulfur cluster assembly accessory protein